jgi:hypothetical protein
MDESIRGGDHEWHVGEIAPRAGAAKDGAIWQFAPKGGGLIEAVPMAGEITAQSPEQENHGGEGSVAAKRPGAVLHQWWGWNVSGVEGLRYRHERANIGYGLNVVYGRINESRFFRDSNRPRAGELPKEWV